MRRIGLAVALTVGLTVAPLAGETQQQTEKVYRIGVLSPESPPPGLLNEFEQELRKLGYIKGKNVAIELRHAEGKSERLAALADELVRLTVDVILAVNTSAVQAAKNATTTIPIVMTRVADPVRIGLISSISRPGGNVTGLSFMIEELSIKRLQLLKEAIPTISRVAVLWYTGNPGGAGVAKEMEGASAQFGLRFLRLPVQGPGDFPGAFEAANRDRAEALHLVDDAVITRHRDAILNLAAKHKLPVTSQYKPFAEGGGLIAYGASTAAMYRRAAQYVDKILKGAKPADLPVEQPTEFELVINLKTARALGLTIPQTLLLRADEVIQ